MQFSCTSRAPSTNALKGGLIATNEKGVADLMKRLYLFENQANKGIQTDAADAWHYPFKEILCQMDGLR